MANGTIEVVALPRLVEHSRRAGRESTIRKVERATPHPHSPDASQHTCGHSAAQPVHSQSHLPAAEPPANLVNPAPGRPIGSGSGWRCGHVRRATARRDLLGETSATCGRKARTPGLRSSNLRTVASHRSVRPPVASGPPARSLQCHSMRRAGQVVPPPELQPGWTAAARTSVACPSRSGLYSGARRSSSTARDRSAAPPGSGRDARRAQSPRPRSGGSSTRPRTSV
jgi:hypothetical protein